MKSNVSTSTFLSLAILKVDLDEGVSDYLGYLENFAASLITKYKPDPVTDSELASLFEQEFGLRVPVRGVQLVLRRLAKRGLMKRAHNTYRVTKDLPTFDIASKRVAAQCHIDDLCSSLRSFAENTFTLKWSDEDVTKALLGFLNKSGVDYIRAFVFRTALPEIPDSGPREHYVVARFIRDLYVRQDPLFESVIVFVKGQMYANAIICPDLEGLDKDFRKVCFYFDTSLILSTLNLQGEEDFQATTELITLLQRLRGSVAVFSHTLEEVDGILSFAEKNLHNPLAAQPRVFTHMRFADMKRGDVALLRAHLENDLRKLKFQIKMTPKYVPKYQISESELAAAIRAEIEYKNPGALQFDINSVRSIYVIRENLMPRRLEDTNAVFVTSNALLARAAFELGKEHNSTKEISSTITDYSLANVAWLKAPLGAPDLPKKKTLAACYATLEPARPLWEHYLTEVDKLEASGTITADDHALLRVSDIAVEELMNLTLGEEEAFAGGSVSKILERVKAELVREKTNAIDQEREAHQRTQRDKARLEQHSDFVVKQVYWISRRVAKVLCMSLSVLAIGILVLGASASVLVTTPYVAGSILLTAGVHFTAVLTIGWGIINTFFGTPFLSILRRIEKRIQDSLFFRLRIWFSPNTKDS